MIHSPRDDGSDSLGSRQRRRKGQAGTRQESNETQGRSEPLEAPVAAREWPEYPAFGGDSACAGGLPRHVGVIAFLGWGSKPSLDDLYVCVVRRGNGLETFPRGTTKPKKSLLVSALKMWFNSTGINAGRVQPQRRIHVDDEKHSCRYIVTECDWLFKYGQHKQPDAQAWEWAAPYRASHDVTDPILGVCWSRVSTVVQGRTKVPASRVELLKHALRLRAVGYGWWPQGHLAQGMAQWQGNTTSRDRDAESEERSAKNARPSYSEGGKEGSEKDGVDKYGAAESANWKYLAKTLERKSAESQPSGGAQQQQVQQTMPDCWHFQQNGRCPHGRRCLFHHHSTLLPSRADMACSKVGASATKEGEAQKGSHPSSAAEERSAPRAADLGTEANGVSTEAAPQPVPRSTDDAPANGEPGACHKDGPEDTPEQSSDDWEEAQMPTGSEEPTPPDSAATGEESPPDWSGDATDLCDHSAAAPPGSPGRGSGTATIAGATAKYIQAVVATGLAAGAKSSPTVFTCKTDDLLAGQDGAPWTISTTYLITVIALMAISAVFGRWSAPRAAGEGAVRDPEPWVVLSEDTAPPGSEQCGRMHQFQ